ncbi:MAG: hypothetical protein WBV70_03695 [Candidatus Bathyarchaeia archaeon]
MPASSASAKKLALAVTVAFLLTLIGLSGLGYKVSRINELSFAPDYEKGYAEATVVCDITFNPFINPLNWIVQEGHIKGTFTVVLVSNGPDSIRAYNQAEDRGMYGSPAVSYHATWGATAQERYSNYIALLTQAQVLPNFLILFVATTAIEISRKRRLYAMLFCGIIGFYAFDILGAILGIITGYLALLLLSRFQLHELLRR